MSVAVVLSPEVRLNRPAFWADDIAIEGDQRAITAHDFGNGSHYDISLHSSRLRSALIA